MATRDSNPVWVEGRVVKRTRRCVKLVAVDVLDRRRTCYLPTVHFTASRECPGVPDTIGLRVPAWWAHQNKLPLRTEPYTGRVAYHTGMIASSEGELYESITGRKSAIFDDLSDEPMSEAQRAKLKEWCTEVHGHGPFVITDKNLKPLSIGELTTDLMARAVRPPPGVK